MKVEDCKLIELPKIVDVRGNLSIIEQFKQIPFDIKRVHWIYDVPYLLISRGYTGYMMCLEV